LIFELKMEANDVQFVEGSTRAVGSDNWVTKSVFQNERWTSLEATVKALTKTVESIDKKLSKKSFTQKAAELTKKVTPTKRKRSTEHQEMQQEMQHVPFKRTKK